jgi:uncharacterized protein (UPF0333 family)
MSEHQILKEDDISNKMQITNGLTPNFEETQIRNEPQIFKDHQIPKETQIFNECQILKEPQISKDTQVMNKSQFLKKLQIMNEPQILK